MNVVWTPLAEQRAVEIVRTMRTDRTGAAWRWLQAMLARVRGLSRYEVRQEGLHECYFAPCRIIYRIERDRIVVLALHPVGSHRTRLRFVKHPPAAPSAARGRS